jgi:hypothetical protein
MTERIPKKTKNTFIICRNHETSLTIEQKRTLYTQMCRSNCCEGNTFIYKCVLTIVNSQLSRTVQQKARNLQENWTVHIFTDNKLCLILKFVSSTAHKDNLHSTAMQQTGTVLDISICTTKCVSTV